MKINLSFIPQNTAPLGARSIWLYDSDGNKLKNIPLGNLAPKSKGVKLYTFGALSDVHLPYSTGVEDFIRALNYFNNTEKVNFICISGNMGSTGIDADWANYKAHVDAYSPNTPVYISAGNHDAGQSAYKTYEYPIQYTGNPLYYSFTQGNDVFIMFGLTFWGNPPFSNESLQWLYETLEENRNKRCFVFQHMMRKGHAGDASGRYSWDGLNNTNGQVFLSLMEHYKNVLWFHGHSHCEFEQQDTLALPNSNYDRAFGCHSIHVPSCAMTRNENNSYDYEDSEGYVVDVYKNGIHLRGRDFVAEKFLPIASYWIDTTLTVIAEKSYVDSYGVIDTDSESDGIALPEGSELYIGQKYSGSSGALQDLAYTIAVLIPLEYKADTTYKLKVENLPNSNMITDGTISTLYAIDSSKTKVGYVTGSYYQLSAMTSEYITLNEDETSFEIKCTPISGMTHLALTLRINYEDSVTEDDIKDIVISLDNTAIDKSKIYLNRRYSQTKGEMQEVGGIISVNPSVEPNTTYKISYSGAKTDIRASYDSLYLVNSDGVVSAVHTVNGSTNISSWTEGVVYNADYTGVDVTFTTGADTVKIWFSIPFNPAGTYIHNVDEITDVVLTLEKINYSNDEITLPENTTYTLNARDSYSGKATKDEAGMIRFYIPCEANTNYNLNVENLPIDITSSSAGGNTGALFCWDMNKTNVSVMQEHVTSSIIDFINSGLITVTNNNKSFSMNLTTSDSAGYIALSLVISTTEDITEEDIKDVVITLKKPSVNIVPTLLDTDLTNVYNDIGYKANVRIKSTGETVDLAVTYRNTLTGLIPLEKDGDILHIRGVDSVLYLDARWCGYISLWDSTGGFLAGSIVIPTKTVSTDKNGDFAMIIDYAELTITDYPTASYIRLQLGEVTDELIITRNQLID